MAGISEALVATAVGLMVAIPAVIAFNFFQGEGARDAGAHRRGRAPGAGDVHARRSRRRGDAGARRGEGLTHGRAAQAATATTTTPVG